MQNHQARQIVVELTDRSYPVVVGETDTASWLDPLRVFAANRPVAVVSDVKVAGLYKDRFSRALADANVPVLSWHLIPEGEASKSIQQLIQLHTELLEAGLSRDGIICALGGGVVGDLAGFAAATLFRGVEWINAPTTLLAMVDAAIGGKTGINHRYGKNLIGAFHQPSAVLINVPVLQTLPPRELRSGLAEVIKYGVIADAGLFSDLETHVEEILSLSSEPILEIVARSAKIKGTVVGHDEREAGERMILNFGHTFGHAIEATTGFGTWTHGEAVAVGMVLAAEFGVTLEKTHPSVPVRIADLCASFELPTSVDKVHFGSLGEAVGYDKKIRRDHIKFVVPVDIGRVEICSIELDDLTTWLQRSDI